jgi:hypothetical protein
MAAPPLLGPDQRYMKNGLLEPRKAAVLDFTEDLPLRGVELLLGEQPLGEESPELVQPGPLGRILSISISGGAVKPGMGSGDRA